MSEERKGVLLPEQEKLVAKALDFWFKFKNQAVEKFDYYFFLGIVKAGDNIGMQKLPLVWKEKLIPIVDSAINEDIESVRKSVSDLMNEKINLPALDDYQETIVFDQFTKFIAVVIEFYLLHK